MKKKIRLFLILFSALLIVITAFFVWQNLNKDNFVTVESSLNLTKEEPKVKEEKTVYPIPETYQVPILMYHYIRDASAESELGKNLSVHPDNFDLHMAHLKGNDYETLTLADFADPEKKVLSKIIADNKKPIVLTFDDGYLDAYTQAFPILQKYDFVATFYIIRYYIGKAEYMNADQIQELSDAGMEIGSHTLTHPNLAKSDSETVSNQLIESKENATTLCYPAGAFDATTVKLVQEAGYNAAVTTKFGIADKNSSILELPRVRVEDGGVITLQHKIETAF